MVFETRTIFYLEIWLVSFSVSLATQFNQTGYTMYNILPLFLKSWNYQNDEHAEGFIYKKKNKKKTTKNKKQKNKTKQNKK